MTFERFRLSRDEAAMLHKEIMGGKNPWCSTTIWREIGELARLGKGYPYREDQE